MPNPGLAYPRAELDAMLTAKTQESGAVLRKNVTIVGPILRKRNGRVIGVKAKSAGCGPLAFKAPVVVDAGGASACLAVAVGYEKAMNRPMGVVYQTYFRLGRSADPAMGSHPEPRKGKPGKSSLMPSYGWIFPFAGGIVNVGLESLSSTAKATELDYRVMFKAWMVNTSSEWGFTEENQIGRLRGAVLPIALDRELHYANGLLPIDDVGGIVSSFNEEGTTYALQVGRLAVDTIVQTHSCLTITAKGRALMVYPTAMCEELGGYYSLERVFARLVGRSRIIYMCIAHGLSRPTLMRLIMRLFSDCCDRRGGDWTGRLISASAKTAPET